MRNLLKGEKLSKDVKKLQKQEQVLTNAIIAEEKKRNNLLIEQDNLKNGIDKLGFDKEKIERELEDKEDKLKLLNNDIKARKLEYRNINVKELEDKAEYLKSAIDVLKLNEKKVIKKIENNQTLLKEKFNKEIQELETLRNSLTVKTEKEKTKVKELENTFNDLSSKIAVKRAKDKELSEGLTITQRELDKVKGLLEKKVAEHKREERGIFDIKADRREKIKELAETNDLLEKKEIELKQKCGELESVKKKILGFLHREKRLNELIPIIQKYFKDAGMSAEI